MRSTTDNKHAPEIPPLPPFELDFLHNPVYISVTAKTIKEAMKAYSYARVLSIILFSVGIALLITSIVLGIVKNDTLLTIFFGGLGATSIFSLLLYKPIERIQTGVDDLIKAQIACVSFTAQYSIIMRSLSENYNLSLENRLKMAQQMKELTSQLIDDLNNT